MNESKKYIKENNFPSGFEIAQMVGCGDIYKKSLRKNNQLKENKTIVKITENQLNRIIKESVKKILNQK